MSEKKRKDKLNSTGEAESTAQNSFLQGALVNDNLEKAADSSNVTGKNNLKSGCTGRVTGCED